VNSKAKTVLFPEAPYRTEGSHQRPLLALGGKGAASTRTSSGALVSLGGSGEQLILHSPSTPGRAAWNLRDVCVALVKRLPFLR
jgi:hypothetical protein